MEGTCGQLQTREQNSTDAGGPPQCAEEEQGEKQHKGRACFSHCTGNALHSCKWAAVPTVAAERQSPILTMAEAQNLA